MGHRARPVRWIMPRRRPVDSREARMSAGEQDARDGSGQAWSRRSVAGCPLLGHERSQAQERSAYCAGLAPVRTSSRCAMCSASPSSRPGLMHAVAHMARAVSRRPQDQLGRGRRGLDQRKSAAGNQSGTQRHLTPNPEGLNDVREPGHVQPDTTTFSTRSVPPRHAGIPPLSASTRDPPVSWLILAAFKPVPSCPPPTPPVVTSSHAPAATCPASAAPPLSCSSSWS